MKIIFCGAAIIFSTFFICSCSTETVEIYLEVAGSNQDGTYVPIYAEINLPDKFDGISQENIKIEMTNENTGESGIPGQLVIDSKGKSQIWWILPSLKAKSSYNWIAVISEDKNVTNDNFVWQDHSDRYLDLLFNDKKVTRFIYGYDTTSEQGFFETYKPFLHVFAKNGVDLITEGPDGDNYFDENKILYPHHRGLFFGWPLTCDGESMTFWGMNSKDKKRCAITQKFLERSAGPVLARSNALIHWNDKEGNTIIREERITTIYRADSSSLVVLDFESAMESVKGEIVLKGNADHGGLHFRPHNDVAIVNQSWRYLRLIKEDNRETKADVAHRGGATEPEYYFPADSIVPYPRDPGDKRNIKILSKYPDLPWTAMSYGLRGVNYTVQHMNHKDNPGPTGYSAYRGYGRFGAWYQGTIPKGKTLNLKYRIWISLGKPPTRDQMAARYAAYVNEPKIIGIP